MADSKRNIFDDIADGLRRTLEELERLLNPEKRAKRERVPVRIPVRNDRRYPRNRR